MPLVRAQLPNAMPAQYLNNTLFRPMATSRSSPEHTKQVSFANKEAALATFSAVNAALERQSIKSCTVDPVA